MPDATKYRIETAELARLTGWQVTSLADNDQFRRGDVAIDVAYTPKNFVRDFQKHGPSGQYANVERNTVGKIDLLRLWLTGRASSVVNASQKRAAGVEW